MAEVKWTDEQGRAIKERDCSLLVAAAAGSGKTAVLVERIIQRILDPNEDVDIDRLVIVTFTEAAASQMRERIEKAISNRINNLAKDDSMEFKRRLKRQLTLLSKATITTMHSFCSKIIRKNFNKIDIDPSFRILDAIEAEIIKSEVLEKVFDEKYEEEAEDSGFYELVDIYGGSRNDEGLKKLILSIYNFISSAPFPEKWMEEQLYKLSPEMNKNDFRYTVWGNILFDKLENEMGELAVKCGQAIELCENAGIDKYLVNLNESLNLFNDIFIKINNNCLWDEIYCLFKEFEFSRGARAGGKKAEDFDEETSKSIERILEEIKETVKAYKEIYFSKDSNKDINDISKTYTILKNICAAVQYFSEEYAQVKRKKRSIDYDDLEHLALKILSENPEIADEMRKFYIEVYTDEYQDTNMTQETILSFITKKDPEIPNLFMVGDIKQSIYGFRHARPDIFLGKYNYFSTGGLKNREKLIKLYKNFRSRRDIIGSVNYIFSSIMTKEVCKMDYDRGEYLYCGADYDEPDWDISCELLLTDSKAESEGDYADRKKLEIEGAMIAKRIEQLVNDPCHKINYRDIVVLMRSTKDRAETFKEVFSEYNIPVFCDVNMGFYQSREVEFVISMLRIIDNPIQDIPLLAVLKAPIGGFDEDDIAVLRLINKDTDLYYNLNKIVCAEIETETKTGTKAKAANFLDKLSQLREEAVSLTLSELILRIFRETDCFNYAGIFPDGQQRQANLRKLYEEAVTYEEQTGNGIFDFLNYVNKISESSGDMGGAAVLGENDNVVRIMSIHKSKGLEFPVVFIASMDKGMNRRDFNESIVMHQELGFGADYYDAKLRIKYETITKTVMKLELNNELIAEEMRLLYVAMTRAREKLIMAGTIADIGETMRKYWGVLPVSGKNKTLPSYYILKAKSYFDLIMPVLIKHPDMENLRNMAEIVPGGNELLKPGDDEECKFKAAVYGRDEIFQRYGEKYGEDEKDDIYGAEIEVYNKELYREIEERLEYKYNFQESVELPVKISVSEMKGKENQVQLIRKPVFLEGEKKNDAARLGTAVHYVMQYINFSNITESEIERLCASQGLTESEMKNINKNIIINFFKGDIGRRLLASKNICREIPFTMSVEAGEIYDNINTENEETILVQGIIDCYFEEGGEIVILDYKTDWYERGKGEAYAQKYKTQLDMYAKALESATKMKIKEKIVCFLNFGEYFYF